MIDTKHASGSGNGQSPSRESAFRPKGKAAVVATPSSPSPRPMATVWDITSDEIAATVLAELRI